MPQVDLRTWDWYVVGDPSSCQEVLQKTRGLELQQLMFLNQRAATILYLDPPKVPCFLEVF